MVGKTGYMDGNFDTMGNVLGDIDGTVRSFI